MTEMPKQDRRCIVSGPIAYPSWRFIALTLCLIALPAWGKPNVSAGPGSKAALTAAMSSAHKIFLRYGGDESRAARYTADYVAFYQGMQRWGRYRLLPSTEGADLIVVYAAFCRGFCSVTVYDGKTMAWIGDIRRSIGRDPFHLSDETRRTDALEFVEALSPYAGASGSTSAPGGQQVVAPPILPLPAWAASSFDASAAPSLVKVHIATIFVDPASEAFQAAFEAWAKKQHTVLIVDRGLTMSEHNPFGRKDALTMFEHDLSTWGRYKLVSTLADADFVIEVNATSICDEYSCSNEMHMVVEDPKTLRMLTTGSVSANLHFRKNHIDQFLASVQDLTDLLEDTLGYPVNQGPDGVVGCQDSSTGADRSPP
jgi:hypothetical protein